MAPGSTQGRTPGKRGPPQTGWWLLLLFSCSVLSESFVTPWTLAHQAPLSMGILQAKYWSGLPCPPPGNLPDPGIEPASPALAETDEFFTTEPPGKHPLPPDRIGLNYCPKPPIQRPIPTPPPDLRWAQRCGWRSGAKTRRIGLLPSLGEKERRALSEWGGIWSASSSS